MYGDFEIEDIEYGYALDTDSCIETDDLNANQIFGYVLGSAAAVVGLGIASAMAQGGPFGTFDRMMAKTKAIYSDGVVTQAEADNLYNAAVRAMGNETFRDMNGPLLMAGDLGTYILENLGEKDLTIASDLEDRLNQIVFDYWEKNPIH